MPILAAGLFLIACGDRATLTQDELKQFAEAQTLYRNRKFDDALERLARLHEQRPGAIEVASLQARILFFTKRFAESEQVLNEVLAEDPDNPHVLMWLGKTISIDPSRQAEAAEHFRLILKRDPENFMARYYLGRCLESQQKIRPALLEYQEALAMEYQLSKIHLHMGRLLIGMNMEDRARNHFERVRALDVNQHDIGLAQQADDENADRSVAASGRKKRAQSR